jgi:hypothetical protein
MLHFDLFREISSFFESTTNVDMPHFNLFSEISLLFKPTTTLNVGVLNLDLFYEISFFCKPFTLSISKDLHKIYTDNWFKTFLENKYPDKKLFTVTNYKDLYKRWLKEGDVYRLSDGKQFKLKTKGLKAQCNYPMSLFWGIYHDLILTFNGELYMELFNEVKLIDTKVIDISSCGYIRENATHVKINMNTNERYYFHGQLHKIMQHHSGTIILSSEGIYKFSNNENTFNEMKDCIDIFINKNKDICILDKYGNIYNMVNDEIIKSTFDPSPIYEITYQRQPGRVKFVSNKLYFNDKEIDTNVKNMILDDNDSDLIYYIK